MTTVDLQILLIYLAFIGLGGFVGQWLARKKSKLVRILAGIGGMVCGFLVVPVVMALLLVILVVIFKVSFI